MGVGIIFPSKPRMEASERDEGTKAPGMTRPLGLEDAWQDLSIPVGLLPRLFELSKEEAQHLNVQDELFFANVERERETEEDKREVRAKVAQYFSDLHDHLASFYHADGSSREEKVTSTGADSDSDEPEPQRQDRREVAPLLSDRAGLGMKAEVAGDAYAAFRQDKSVVYHRFIRGSGRKKRAKR